MSPLPFILKTCLPVAGWIFWQLLAGNAVAQQSASSPQEVIVLTDGRVFTGQVSPVAGGVRIDVQGQSMILPDDYILARSSTLFASYEQIRSNREDPTAAQHLDLAEWCCRNSMYNEARQEIADGLKLEPGHQGLLRLRGITENKLNPAGPVIPASAEVSSNPEQMILQQERSFMGLTRETHRLFIAKVQPLLLNTCGNAACHGRNPDRAFSLTMVRRSSPGHRTGSADNLRAVLEQIDPDHPEESPLLRKPQELEGVHHGLFLGEQKARYYAMLTEWVTLAARDRRTSTPRNTPSQVVPAGASSLVLTPQGVQHASAEVPEPSQPSPLADPGAALETLRQKQMNDPFSPDLFNRRVHGESVGQPGIPTSR